MSEDVVTLGELGRRIDGMGKSLDKLADAVHQMDKKQSADFIRLGHLEARVASLEDWKTWAMRIVIGAVIAGVLALVLT